MWVFSYSACAWIPSSFSSVSLGCFSSLIFIGTFSNHRMVSIRSVGTGDILSVYLPGPANRINLQTKMRMPCAKCHVQTTNTRWICFSDITTRHPLVRQWQRQRQPPKKIRHEACFVLFCCWFTITRPFRVTSACFAECLQQIPGIPTCSHQGE